jgi:hypothetical protein
VYSHVWQKYVIQSIVWYSSDLRVWTYHRARFAVWYIWWNNLIDCWLRNDQLQIFHAYLVWEQVNQYIEVMKKWERNDTNAATISDCLGENIETRTFLFCSRYEAGQPCGFSIVKESLKIPKRYHMVIITTIIIC